MTDAFTRLAAALADRYHIERALGEGGMAIVYLAEDLKHHRKVAIKVLKPRLAAMRRWRSCPRPFSPVVIASGLLLSAALSGRIVGTLDAQVLSAGAAAGYTYACPGGADTIEPVPGVCAAVLPSNGGPRGGLAIALGRRKGVAGIAMGGTALARVFVTTDSGRHWRAVGLPPGLASIVGTGGTTPRVALRFDDRGHLHLLDPIVRDTAADLYYTSSPDLGVTWTRPVLIDRDEAGSSLAPEFPKLTTAGRRLYATWGYRGDYLLHVAWSADGGISWSEAKDPPTDCINVSEVTTVHGTAYVACSGFMPQGDLAAGTGRNPFTGLRLYSIDASGVFTLQATLRDFKGVWPRLLAGPDGSFVLVANVYHFYAPATRGWDKCCAAMSRSVDGRDWSRPVSFRGSIRGADGWDTFSVEPELDSLGRLHVLANGSHQPIPGSANAGEDARIVHAVLDPTSGSVIAESYLTPPADGRFGYYPGSAGLAFLRMFGLIAWSSANRLLYTRVEPPGPTSTLARHAVATQPRTPGQIARVRRIASEDSALSSVPSPLAGTYRFVVRVPTGDSAVIYTRTERYPMQVIRAWKRNDVLEPEHPITGYDLMAVCAVSERALQTPSAAGKSMTCEQSVSAAPWRQARDSTVWRGNPEADLVASFFFETTPMGPVLDEMLDEEQGDSTAYYMPGYWTTFPDGRVRFARDIWEGGKLVVTIRGERISTAVLPGRSRGVHELW